MNVYGALSFDELVLLFSISTLSRIRFVGGAESGRALYHADGIKVYIHALKRRGLNLTSVITCDSGIINSLKISYVGC